MKVAVLLKETRFKEIEVDVDTINPVDAVNDAEKYIAYKYLASQIEMGEPGIMIRSNSDAGDMRSRWHELPEIDELFHELNKRVHEE